MRQWLAALWMALALSPAPSLVAGTVESVSSDTTWMTVQLAGRRIGHLRIDRVNDGKQVTTTQDLRIEINRNGKTIPMSVLTRSVETLDSQPLGFYSRSMLSTSDSIVDGRRQADGRYVVTTTVAGRASESTLAWPVGALLSDGQRQAMAGAASRSGHYTLSLFDPASQDVATVDIEVLGNERVSLPEGSEVLNHQREVLQTPRGVQRMDLWVNQRGETRKSSLDMLGHPLDLLACSEACALAPVEDIDMLRASMVDSPQGLSVSMRQGGLRYVIHVADGDSQPVISTDEQRVSRLGNGDWLVDVGNAVPGGQAPPTPADTQANAWVQSDAPPIRALAAEASIGAEDDQQKMLQLRDFVSGYIQPHGRDIGYASALEVVRLRAGDCKAHAVLLAALARAQHIPARVVTGMVYADRYGGSRQVFVPHAWVQAWVHGRWQSFDAALGHFDSAHLALDSGDGDPWHFVNLANLFGQMRIAHVGAAPEQAATAMGGAVATRD